MGLSKNDKVAVLGSQGFIGRNLVEFLSDKCVVITDDKSIDYRDLNQTQRFFFLHQPDYVINCVGRNGNILFNKEFPAQILEDNTKCINNILNTANAIKVEKILSLVASCAYPEHLGQDLQEKDLLSGPPSDSVIGHAYAKRHVQILSNLYNKQYGLKTITACPTTVFGPGDSLDLNKTKIMNSLIVKFLQAKKSRRQVSLGSPVARRQFIYVKDVVEILTHLLLEYNDPSETINLANAPDLSIKELAEKIYNLSGYTGNIEWADSNIPTGQVRKQLNYTKLHLLLPNQKYTDFNTSLEATIKDVEKRL